MKLNLVITFDPKKSFIYFRKLGENFFKYKQLGNKSMVAINNSKRDVKL